MAYLDNTEITVDCKISALGRASWRGNLKTVELLVHVFNILIPLVRCINRLLGSERSNGTNVGM